MTGIVDRNADWRSPGGEREEERYAGVPGAGDDNGSAGITILARLDSARIPPAFATRPPFGYRIDAMWLTRIGPRNGAIGRYARSSTVQRHQRSLADRPTLPKADGGRVVFVVPERGPVEDREPVSLVGSDRGE
jgi:hypothetical protein